ncbi:MAG: ABC transporter ATP-binding protein, partial [Fusicatenibacter saccharivorans]
MNDNAITVDHVSKLYKLYDKPSDRFKEAMGLTKKKLYREHYALRDVSFHVRRGESIGIIGTNGSGKSTMLKIITGVLNPTEGQVNVNGRISALLELGAGFNGEYSGIENVYLNGTMNGFSREEIDARMDDILRFADIGEFVNQPVKTYSSGMFVRLAFAVAINIEPEILIVDEALSVGDVFFQAKCFRKFEEFREMGKTLLMVSHDLSSISKYSDKVILLNQGTMVDEGEPKYIVDLYKRFLVHQEGNPEEEKKQKEEAAATISEEQEVAKKTAEE